MVQMVQMHSRVLCRWPLGSAGWYPQSRVGVRVRVTVRVTVTVTVREIVATDEDTRHII